jgi:hypothetical protein
VNHEKSTGSGYRRGHAHHRAVRLQLRIAFTRIIAAFVIASTITGTIRDGSAKHAVRDYQMFSRRER